MSYFIHLLVNIFGYCIFVVFEQTIRLRLVSGPAKDDMNSALARETSWTDTF